MWGWDIIALRHLLEVDVRDIETHMGCMRVVAIVPVVVVSCWEAVAVLEVAPVVSVVVVVVITIVIVVVLLLWSSVVLEIPVVSVMRSEVLETLAFVVTRFTSANGLFQREQAGLQTFQGVRGVHGG